MAARGGRFGLFLPWKAESTGGGLLLLGSQQNGSKQQPLVVQTEGGAAHGGDPSVLGVARGCKNGAVRVGSALLRGLLPLVFLGSG